MLYYLLEYADIPTLKRYLNLAIDITGKLKSGSTIIDHILEYDIEKIYILEEFGLDLSPAVIDGNKLFSKYKPRWDKGLTKFKFLDRYELDFENRIKDDKGHLETFGYDKYKSRDWNEDAFQFIKIIIDHLEYSEKTSKFYIVLISNLLRAKRVDLIEQIKGLKDLHTKELDDLKWRIYDLETYMIMKKYSITIDQMAISGYEDIKLLRYLLNENPEIFEKNKYNFLRNTIHKSYTENALFFLEQNIDINRILPQTSGKFSIEYAQNSYLMTALDKAEDIQSERVIYKILELNPDVNFIQPDTGRTALLAAINNQWDIEIIKNIINRDADLNILGFYKSYGDEVTPLMVVVANGNIDLIKLLLTSGANVRIKSSTLGKNCFDYTTNNKIINLLTIYKNHN